MKSRRAWITARCPKCDAPNEVTVIEEVTAFVECHCGARLANGNGRRVSLAAGVVGTVLNADRHTRAEYRKAMNKLRAEVSR